MLYTKNDSATYIQQFKKKMDNFCEKAPLLLSYTTTPQGVQIVNEHTDDVFDVTWDFSVPVKLFIYGIKQILRKNDWYPLLIKTEETLENLSYDEQITLASNGVPLDQVPTVRRITTEHKYLIDKVIMCKDIFIIEDIKTEQKFRYHMNKSSGFFLKKMRSGRMDHYQAADYFFGNSSLMNELINQDENNNTNVEIIEE